MKNKILFGVQGMFKKEFTIQLGKRKCNADLFMNIEFGSQRCFTKGKSYTQIGEDKRQFILVDDMRQHNFISKKGGWGKCFSERYLTVSQKEQEKKRLNKLIFLKKAQQKILHQEINTIHKNIRYIK